MVFPVSRVIVPRSPRLSFFRTWVDSAYVSGRTQKTAGPDGNRSSRNRPSASVEVQVNDPSSVGSFFDGGSAQKALILIPAAGAPSGVNTSPSIALPGR